MAGRRSESRWRIGRHQGKFVTRLQLLAILGGSEHQEAQDQAARYFWMCERHDLKDLTLWGMLLETSVLKLNKIFWASQDSGSETLMSGHHLGFRFGVCDYA